MTSNNIHTEKMTKRNKNREVSVKVSGEGNITDTKGKYRGDRRKKQSDYEQTIAGWN